MRPYHSPGRNPISTKTESSAHLCCGKNRNSNYSSGVSPFPQFQFEIQFQFEFRWQNVLARRQMS